MLAAISNGATNNITVLSDGNKTGCITNSSGTFCYSLSYAMNHLITDDTTVLLASPEIDVLDHSPSSQCQQFKIHGQGIDNTTICYYKDEIKFFNVTGLEMMSLSIHLCLNEPRLSNDSGPLHVWLFQCYSRVM